MKKISIIFTLLISILCGLQSCSSTDWDKMPERIRIFIDKYFNSTDIQTYTESGSQYLVVIKNGSALTFNEDYSWITIDGRGGTLPEILISDQLPKNLYDFLFNMEVANKVYELDRNDEIYRVKLEDGYVEYDIDKGTVSYPDRVVGEYSYHSYSRAESGRR